MERICSTWSKFFPLREDPISEGFVVQKSNQEVTKVVPLYKNGRKYGGPPFTMKNGLHDCRRNPAMEIMNGYPV